MLVILRHCVFPSRASNAPLSGPELFSKGIRTKEHLRSLAHLECTGPLQQVVRHGFHFHEVENSTTSLVFLTLPRQLEMRLATNEPSKAEATL